MGGSIACPQAGQRRTDDRTARVAFIADPAASWFADRKLEHHALPANRCDDGLSEPDEPIGSRANR
jgi:hypothetical protein